MDAYAMPPPPPPQKMRPTINRHIPADIVEKILLNLPLKSVVRFSAVSKSWNSMISGSGFVRRYCGRAALLGSERMAFICGEKASTCLVSSISPNNPSVDGATDFVCTLGNILQHDVYKVEAVCDELWLVGAGKRSLHLWNPSMRAYKQLPNPPYERRRWAGQFFFGLGYESVGDDYKVVMLSYYSYHDRHYMLSADLYSLRNDSWRSIMDFADELNFLSHDFWITKYFSRDILHSILKRTIRDLPSYSDKCVGSSGVSVGEKLHWLSGSDHSTPASIICFDLSTEKFGEVPLREFSISPRHTRETISVLRGMLCVSINHISYSDIWVMEEYGVAESWTKKFTIQCFDLASSLILPLYFNEKGESLVRIGERLYLYKDEKSRPVLVHRSIAGEILYVDSLVAPALWSSTNR